MMYTSGWPKNQNKCCHNRAEPPAWVSKKCDPSLRSNSSMIWAAVKGGIANKISTPVASIIHTNSGSRQRVIPGRGGRRSWQSG